MKRLFSAFFLVLTTTAFSWALRTGTYDVKGNTPAGDLYQGEVVIAPQGKNYQLTWYFNGQKTITGIGIHRDWEQTLSVAYYDLTLNRAGVISYKVGFFDELEGKWSPLEGATQGYEKLTPKRY